MVLKYATASTKESRPYFWECLECRIRDAGYRFHEDAIQDALEHNQKHNLNFINVDKSSWKTMYKRENFLKDLSKRARESGWYWEHVSIWHNPSSVSIKLTDDTCIYLVENSWEFVSMKNGIKTWESISTDIAKRYNLTQKQIDFIDCNIDNPFLEFEELHRRDFKPLF